MFKSLCTCRALAGASPWGVPHHHNFFGKMDKNRIAWKSHTQAFAEEFPVPGVGVLVAEGVVGKIYCPWKDPSSPAVGRMVLSGCGKLICRFDSEFSWGGKTAPPAPVVMF